MRDFGYLLREKHKKKGFTQFMLAQKIGMSLVQLCKEERNNTSPIYLVRYGNDDKATDNAILDVILPAENALCHLEDSLNSAHTTLLPFVHSFKIDPFGAKTVARYMRAACAVGSAPFSDLVELLEFRNVRLHLTKLLEGIQSRSFFDIENHSLSIGLSKDNTPERSIYRIAYELAWMAMSSSMGFKPVRERVLNVIVSRESSLWSF